MKFKELPAIFQNEACIHIYILHKSFNEVFLGEKMLPKNWLERNLEIKRAKQKPCSTEMYQTKGTVVTCPFTIHFFRETFFYSFFNFYFYHTTQLDHHSEISGIFG